MISDHIPVNWTANETKYGDKRVEYHKCLDEPRYGVLPRGNYQEFFRSFDNDTNNSKHEALQKSGENLRMVHEHVMELEINSQNSSQEGSQQSLQNDSCFREHFCRNKPGCNSYMENNKLANEQSCDVPHNHFEEFHLSKYLPQHTHYENVQTPNFDIDLYDFESHARFLEKSKINVYSEPKDIEEIINVLSDEIHVSSADPQLNRNDGSHGSKSLAVCNNQSNPKWKLKDENLCQPCFKKISMFPHPSEVYQLTSSVRKDTSDSDEKEGLINAFHLSKGCCGACGKKIVGQVLMALGKMWHLDHFTCDQCGIQLGTNIFYEADGKAYCENDYINTFSPKCAMCDEPILEKCINALNKSWHPHHFLCCYCKQQFGEEGYHEMNGLAYCSQDFYNFFAPKCFGCGEAIIEGYITALNHQWHVTCFVCFECKEPFTSGSFYDHDGQPFCEQHFNILKKGLCVSCNQIIIGPSITAIGKKYHPGHFSCTFCMQIIYQGTFREHESKPYCHQCSDRLFG